MGIENEATEVRTEEEPITETIAPLPVPTKPELPRVSVDTYAAAAKRKPDQTYGFKSWARRNKLGARTIPEWEAEWRRYLARPIK